MPIPRQNIAQALDKNLAQSHLLLEEARALVLSVQQTNNCSRATLARKLPTDILDEQIHQTTISAWYSLLPGTIDS